MKIIQLNPDNIRNILIQNINDSDTIFIFSTDIVMNSWIDWIITHPEQTKTDAVPFERFLPWDQFKRQFLAAKKEDYTTVPTLLRKFFVSDLIEQNAQKPESERFKVIIKPENKYATTADSFCEWICSIIPSLHLWKNKIDENKAEYGDLDDEDKDYLYIYEQYSAFLEKNKLFEPSWIENIEFTEKNKKYIIFFPEQFLDFPDFYPILEKTENITLCMMEKNLPQPAVHVYPDSRKELRTTMLRMIQLVQENKADWSEIALSIPNIDTYRPYIEREFNLYKIPYVIKSGISLTKNCAGRIFREINDCYTSDFSFESVRTLLLDEYVPWKEELKQKREDLIREGNRMRCICSPYDKDIWLSAFNSKLSRLEKSDNKEELQYFEELKKFYNDITHAVKNFFSFSEEYSTFEHINRAWMEFKSQFLQSKEHFTEDANNILSRCLKELDEIIKIEKDYAFCNFKINSPFNFFLQILDSKTYTPQTTATGIQIFNYKVSAAAYFKYQFVIDSSQQNLEVSYKRLLFLNSTKRAKLHLIDEDKRLNVTDVYLKLYAKQTESADSTFVHFSAATDTFNGFSIYHSLLNKNKKYPVLDDKDYILNEKNYIMQKTQTLKSITDEQKHMFEAWKKTSLLQDEEYKINSNIQKLIELKINPENQKLNVSARGDMELFFPCPRKWILKSILKFHDDTLDTNLMQNYDIGNLNHKILETFLNNFINQKLPYFDEQTNNFIAEQKEENQVQGNLVECTEKVTTLLRDSIDSAIYGIKDFRDSPLVIQTLKDQKNQIFESIFSILQKYLLPFEQGYFGNCTVYSLEKNYSSEKEFFNYFGRIDTILKTPDNDLIIIDYKNSTYSLPNVKDLKVNDNGILTDFQMPVYYKIASDSTKNDIYSMTYYIFKNNSKREVINPNSKDKTLEDYEPTLNRIDEYAKTLAQKVQDKDFEPHQSNNKKDINSVNKYKDCNKCLFKTICRTTYSIAPKDIKNLEEK